MDKVQIIEELFSYILPYTYLLLPLALVISFFLSKRYNKEVIILAIYGILFFCLLYFYEDIQGWLGKKWYQTLYTFFEYLAFASLLFINIDHKKSRNLILIFSCLFFVFQCIYFFIAKHWVLDTFPIGFETILIFIYIFFFFYQFFKNTENLYIYHDPCFWLSVGMMIYLGGSFFFYILANNLPKEERQQSWYLTYIIEIMKNILFTVAVVVYSRRPKENAKKEPIPYLDMTFE